MIAFFVILVVLMVLVFAAGSWNRTSGRRVVVDRPVRRPQQIVEVERDVVAPAGYTEEVIEEPAPRPVRRVVRRRSY